MPSLNLTMGQSGPLLQVSIGVSAPHRDAILKAGKQPPAPVQGTFLVDTGASATCVDPGLVKSLNLAPTGATMILTPSTNGKPQACHHYDVMMIVESVNPVDPPLIIEAMPIIETHLRSQGIDGLIGRDVLQRCLLIANGPGAHFTLAY